MKKYTTIIRVGLRENGTALNLEVSLLVHSTSRRKTGIKVICKLHKFGTTAAATATVL